MASSATTPRAENPQRDRMTTFAQYQRAVEIAMRERRGLRRGQTFSNVLLDLEPELAQRLTGTAEDPFYNDAKLPRFLIRVAEELR